MKRHLFSVAAVLAALYSCVLLAQSAGSEIMSDTLAAKHGLTRSWFTQVQMDSGISRLKDLVLYDGIIYAQTNRAMVHAIDAETGATLWAKQIGRAEHPSMAPGVGRDLLAIVNGSRLYVANRLNGDILLDRDIDGAPGAGPAVSDQRVYVPMVKGLMQAYRIEQLVDPLKKLAKETPISSEETTQQKQESTPENTEDRKDIHVSQETNKPLMCQSYGNILVQPLVTKQTNLEEYIVWSTDKGYMYIGRVNRESPTQIEIKYGLETPAPIKTQPTYLPPDPEISGDSGIILAATGDGFVHAILEKTGESLWRFSTGEPLSQPAAVIDERIYAATPFSGLHCINVKTGKQIWHAPGIVQFAAASKNRVYVVDKLGLTRILDAATGAQLDVLPTASIPIKMLNADTDRIYLASTKGLIQCLHEIGLPKPIAHGEARKKAAEEAAKAGSEQKTQAKTAEEKPTGKKETAKQKSSKESTPDQETEKPENNAKTGDDEQKPVDKNADKTEDPFAK